MRRVDEIRSELLVKEKDLIIINIAQHPGRNHSLTPSLQSFES
jgi:hypothetical protein